MRYLPITIDTKNKSIIVFGGGDIVLERVKTLLETEFKIYLVSDKIIDELWNLAKENPERLLIKEMIVDEKFVFFDFDYCIIATMDMKVNAALENRAKKNNIPYEREDILSESSFNFMKSSSIGQITLGVSSDANNTSLENIVFEDIEKLTNSYNPQKFDILSKIRTALVRKNTPNIDEIIKNLYDDEHINLNTYLNNINVEARAEKENNMANLKDYIKDLNKASKKTSLDDLKRELKEEKSEKVIIDKDSKKNS